MSNKKLTFNEFLDKEFDDVDVYCGVNKLSHYDISKISWNFCQAQEKREIEELEKKVDELEKEGFALAANQCCAEDCGIHFEEGTSLFCKHEQENKALKKNLSEAVEVIEFYGNQENWYSHGKDSTIKRRIDLNDGEEFLNYEYGGRRARAFLKGNKDE